MSLQVWLPLNGNLNNQGLNDVTATGGTVNDTGILGKCYACASSSYVTIQNPVTDKYEFSFSFWMKVPTSLSSAEDWLNMFTFVALATNDSTTETYMPISWAPCDAIKIYSGSSHQDVWMYPGNQFNYDKWCHYTITHSGDDSSTTIKVYTDGILRETSNDSQRLILRSGSIHLGSGIDPSYGPIYFNDFRLYDHCLSAKEVKEISKGMIGHWKLDNGGFGNPNLVNTSNPLKAGGRTVVADRKLIISAIDTTADTYFTIKLAEAIQADVEYTLSCDVEDMNCNTNWNFPLFAQGNPISKVLVISPGASKASITFTVPTGSSYVGTTTIFMDDARRPSTNPNNITLSNFKLEIGSVATQWCPHTSDPMYSALGLDLVTESDSSGLSNNGTKIGGLSISASPQSIRYDNCYTFDGNTGCIQIPNLATMCPSGEFTMNCWIYHDDTWSSKTYETIFGGPSGFELDAKPGTTNSPALYACDWGKASAAYELNKWNMITMTRDASETKFYINGELKITGSAGTIPSGNYFIGAWNTSSQQNYKGRISDFRLYSTVLSVEDIKMLYNTSASVDKNGNMYAYEFKEE